MPDEPDEDAGLTIKTEVVETVVNEVTGDGYIIVAITICGETVHETIRVTKADLEK